MKQNEMKQNQIFGIWNSYPVIVIGKGRGFNKYIKKESDYVQHVNIKYNK